MQPMLVDSRFTPEGFERPIHVSDSQVSSMDEDACRREITILRDRLSQFETTLENVVEQFDRTLGQIYTLPALQQAKILLCRE